jgi:hypothetical protein
MHVIEEEDTCMSYVEWCITRHTPASACLHVFMCLGFRIQGSGFRVEGIHTFELACMQGFILTCFRV